MDILHALIELKKGNKVVSQYGNIYEYTDNIIVLYRDKVREIPTKSAINTTVVTELLQDDSKFDLYEEPIVLKAGDKYNCLGCTYELVSNKDETLWGLCNLNESTVFMKTKEMRQLLNLKTPGYKKVT